MDETTFWSLLDAARKASRGIPEVQVEDLERRLRALPPDDIVDFDRRFRGLLARAYDWRLWGAAYVVGGGCSDDGFEYFRGWLISRGRDAYEAALADPESLADVVTDADGDAQVEGFAYAASRAWEAATGKGPDEFPYADVPSPPEPSGEPWSEEDVDDLYPRLAELFG